MKTVAAPVERGLLLLASLFLSGCWLSLLLAPAVRQADPNLFVWDWQLAGGWLLCMLGIWGGHFWLNNKLPQRDPLLFAIGSMLGGWGVFVIWRLEPPFGMRQAVWLVLSVAVCCWMASRNDLPKWLRRYPYLWLLSGLLLVALTFFWGTNPSGAGQKLWLGCCGLFFQPAELLKLMLVVYLAAYLANRQPLLGHPSQKWFGQPRPTAFFVPMILMWLFTLILLFLQQDLGASSLLFGLFVVIVYIATGNWLYLPTGALLLFAAGTLGYQLFTVVQQRVDTWWNPWRDASGTSYQVVQSLLAIANGGIFGRGFGIGAPRIIPVVHSDFIYAAIVAEWGWLGGSALLLLLAILVTRLSKNAFITQNVHQRRLLAGIATWFALQSLLIIGGVMRAVPLTGVTTPFLAYGGSGLLLNFSGLAIAMRLSAAGGTTHPATTLR
jgi:cell division protein FtsW (lipid II flippase)